jgi:hypothetical protein
MENCGKSRQDSKQSQCGQVNDSVTEFLSRKSKRMSGALMEAGGVFPICQQCIGL